MGYANDIKPIKVSGHLHIQYSTYDQLSSLRESTEVNKRWIFLAEEFQMKYFSTKNFK